MSRFRPTGIPFSSQVTRFPENVPQQVPADSLKLPTALTVVPELADLTRDEIGLLDEVIERAGPSSTTFLTVFKAYNDILGERGLDPHEVLYYGKLLKLGTMRGKNWSEKWKAVKVQQRSAYAARYHETKLQETQFINRGSQLENLQPANTSSTWKLHSHENDSDVSISSAGPETKEADSMSIYARERNVAIEDQEYTLSNVNDGDHYTTPSISPPYRTTPLRTSYLQQSSIQTSTPPRGEHRAKIASPSPRKNIVDITKKPVNSVLNEEEAWNRIRMQRDEIEASQFWKDRLSERCWQVWRQGVQWVVTTNTQVGEARNNLLLRISLQHWKKLYLARRDLYSRIVKLSNTGCYKTFFGVWKAHFKKRKRNRWRQELRQKGKVIRETDRRVLRKDSWVQWRRSYYLRLAQYRHAERVTHYFYSQWKSRFSLISELKTSAEDAWQTSMKKIIIQSWNVWRSSHNLRILEQTISERVDFRLRCNVLTTWYRHTCHSQSSTDFYQQSLIKTSIRSWKASRDRIKVIEGRALKYAILQDRLLVCAIFRVWKARERGKLLERVKAMRLTKNTWSIWQDNIRLQNSRNDLAVSFSIRTSSHLMALASHKWYNAYVTHRNALTFAMQYDAAQLCSKMLLIWRVRLRDKLKMAKMASIARSFFTLRRCWKTWNRTLQAKKRENYSNQFRIMQQKRILYRWLYQAKQQQQLSRAEQTTKNRIDKHVLRDALAFWTNRVIEVKLRELKTTHDHEVTIQASAFEFWRRVHTRHREELSLMENYLMVRQEENTRRVFSHWLAFARITRRRHILLRQKENTVRLSIITRAWDKWQERFSDERLRPTERMVGVQTQRNTIFRAFGLWHSKPKSLPAIRFHAEVLKNRHFQLWRQAMPRALRSREARLKDRCNLLSRFFEKWAEIYRVKMARKAVARSRYLRFPTGSPPSPRYPKSMISSRFSSPQAVADKSNVLSARSFDDNPSTSNIARNRPFWLEHHKLPPKNHEANHKISPKGPRGSGSIRSDDGNERQITRNRLWLELREIRKHPHRSSPHS